MAALCAERLGCFEIDHKFDLGRKFDRQIGRLGTFQHFVDEVGRPTDVGGDIDAVGDEPRYLLGSLD